MATLQRSNVSYTGNWDQLIAWNVASSSSTSIRLTNLDGTVSVLTGTGFNLVSGEPTSGTVTELRLLAADNSTLLTTVTGFSVSLTTFRQNLSSLGTALSQSDFLIGGSGTDIFSPGATNNSDVMTGGAGNDTFNIGSSAAALYIVDYSRDGGGSGVTVNLKTGLATDTHGDTDTLKGIQTVLATNKADNLTGTDFDDFLSPGGGTDILDGGAGFDHIVYSFNAFFNSDTFGFPPNGITVTFTAVGGGTIRDPFGATDIFTNSERIRGTNFADTFNGGPGFDSFTGMAGNDRFNGGNGEGGFAGLDEVFYFSEAIGGGTNGVTVNLALGTATDAFGDTDTLSGITQVVGTTKSDTIIGDGFPNRLLGSGGNDFLDGGGGVGGDILIGGDGFDTARFAGSRSNYTISPLTGQVLVSSPNALPTSLTGIEFLTFDDGTIATPTQTHWGASVDIGAHPAGWLPAAVGDYNNDGTDDFAWYNSSTGNVDIWKLQNGNWAGSSDVGSHPLGWQPAGAGDFSHDGHSDIVWYDATTGNVDIWKLVDGQWAGSVNVGSHPLGWQPAGVGDFNNDGSSDILWYNSTTGNLDIWKIQNGQWAGSVDVGAHPPGWTPAGVGDFNNDGTSDVLWYNSSTGNVDIWKLQNGQWAGSVDAGAHPAGWTPAGVSDFNNDGTSDVLWFNSATGNVEIWELLNAHWASSVDIGSHPAGWTPAGVGDFNHDGTGDVLWRETSTNRVEDWLLSNG